MKIHQILLPAFAIKYEKPILPLEEEDQFKTGVHENFNEVRLYKKHFVAVLSDGLAFSNNRKLFEMTSRTQVVNNINRKILYELIRTRIKRYRFVENAILVFDDWSGNYFHFWNDLMPRLYLCRHLVAKKKLTILVNGKTEIIARTIFPLLGFHNLKYITYDQLCLVANLYYPEFITPHVGSFHEATMRNMKEFVFKKLSVKHNSCRNLRLYISRSKAQHRKVINEDDLSEILVEFGFKIVFAEEYTALEQIHLFKDAEAVMGLHGAGLSNMLFCKEGTKVIELRQRGGVQNNLFYQLASTLGHPYYCYFSEQAVTTDFQQSDIHVEPVNLTRFLSAIFSK